MISPAEDILIDYVFLKKKFSLSKNIARRMIHQYQKKLSYISYKYVIEHSESLGEKSIYRKLFQHLYYTDDDNRHVLPCYFVMHVLLNRLSEMKASILSVVRLRRDGQYKFANLYYEYSPSKNEYVFVDNISCDASKKPCFIVHAVGESEIGSVEKYISCINNIGIINVILANMASHPQYSGKKLALLKDDPLEMLLPDLGSEGSSKVETLRNRFLEEKKVGNDSGFSKRNPNMFYIRHIFVDFLDRQLSLSFGDKFYIGQVGSTLCVDKEVAHAGKTSGAIPVDKVSVN